MKIWVDADSCPVVIKEILYKASERRQVHLTLVANRSLRTPRSPFITSLQVSAGADVADSEILRKMDQGDLVITADIPLAAEVIHRGGHALNPRGELYSVENVRSRLNMRDFLESLRESGVETGGPPPITQSDRQKFANSLDTLLTRFA